MEEKKKVSEVTHLLNLTNRNQLNIEGIVNLGSYNQDQIILETNYGVLEIKGEQLHVQQLNLDQGKVLIDGEVRSLIYTDETFRQKGKGFFSRLMK